MYVLLIVKPKWNNNLKLKINVKVTKSLFSKYRKAWIFSFEPFLISIGEDDKKYDSVIEDNVSTIDSKTKMHQEFKSEGQGN